MSIYSPSLPKILLDHTSPQILPVVCLSVVQLFKLLLTLSIYPVFCILQVWNQTRDIVSRFVKFIFVNRSCLVF